MFGKSDRNEPAQKQGRRLARKSQARRATWRTRTAHSLFGATLSAALIASMTFSGGMLPASATSIEVAPNESVNPVEPNESANPVAEDEETFESEPVDAELSNQGEPSDNSEYSHSKNRDANVDTQEPEGAETLDHAAPKESLDEATDESKSIGESSSDKNRSFSTMAMPTGRNYLTWEVKDASGVHIGGSTVQVQGPRSGNTNGGPNGGSWGRPYNVADCTSDPCHPLSMDQDHRGGYFAVESLRSVSTTNGSLVTHNVSSSNRYGIRPVGSLNGYAWAVSGWSNIPPVNTNNTTNINLPLNWPNAGPWSFDSLTVTSRSSTQFCTTENMGNYYYSLRRADSSSPATSIRRASHNAAESAINTNTAEIVNSSVTVPSGQIANALGITPGGVFYFASQFSSQTNEQRRHVTTYRFDPMVDSTPYPVFTMDLLSPTTGWIVSGDATIYEGSEEFYYAYYSNSPNQINGRDALRMHMYRYSEGNGQRTGEVAHVDVERPNNFTTDVNAMNGDFAFDGQNNLQFIMSDTNGGYTVSGVVNGSELHELPAAHAIVDVPTIYGIANAGRLPQGQRDAINGVAYTKGGRAIIQQGTLNAFADPTSMGILSERSTLSGGGTLVDLASCAEPTTVTVQKYVVGGRAAAGDQFQLDAGRISGGVTSAFQGVTTSGNSSGLQTEQLGPYAMVYDGRFTARETVTANADSYQSDWACYVQGTNGEINEEAPFLEGQGRELGFGLSTATDPDLIPGANILCRFYNTPLIAQVNVHKVITDSRGTNSAPGQDWSVGASAVATSGTIKATPAAETQQTNHEGSASWSFSFGGREHTANLNVQELMQEGYAFDSGTCTVTKPDGSSTDTSLTGAAGNQMLGIVPGDVVDCTFVNTLKPASVSIGKELLDFKAQNPQPAEGWSVGATLGSGSTSGVSISTPSTALTLADGQVEKPWEVHFPNNADSIGNVVVQEIPQDGYEFVNGSCIITSDSGNETEQVLDSVNAVLAGLKPGDAADCTFTNKPKTGTVIWEKVDGASNLLDGSEWELTGPDGAVVEIVDCTAEACTGADSNPKAGQFQITGLEWGQYTLVETKAPAGYLLNEEEFDIVIRGDIEPAQLLIDLGQIENEQREGLALPLTGGLGTDEFLIGGGLALAAALGIIAWNRRKGAADVVPLKIDG